MAGQQGGATLARRLQRDPAFFCEHVLGVDLWSRQVQILEAVRDHARVSVASGNNVGKSFVGACAALWFLSVHPGAKVITTSTSWTGLRERLWAEIHKLVRGSRVPLGLQSVNALELRMAPGWTMLGLSPEQPEGMRGHHAEHILALFDEASGVDDALWDETETNMGSAHARWLVLSNPTRNTGRFFDTWHGQRQLWHQIRISSLDHPNVAAVREGLPVPYPAAVSMRWIEECRAAWGETSALWQTRVLGEFAREATDVLIPLAFLEAGDAQGLAEHLPDLSGRHMGVDPARFGSDSTAAVLVVDGVVTDLRTWHGSDLMASTGRVIDLAREWRTPAENIHVDVIGVGGGIVDRMREVGHHVDAVGFGEKPRGNWGDVVGVTPLLNQRSELYYLARCLLQRRALVVPRKFDRMWAELSTPIYGFNSSGALQVEAKDALRARLGRSPDVADALVLALSRGYGIPQLIW